MPTYSDMKKATSWSVYVVAEFGLDGAATGFHKIGSARNVKYRLSGLKSGNPRLLRVVWQKDYGSRDRAFGIEKMVHKFAPGWVDGTEWFDCPIVEIVNHINVCERLYDGGERHHGFIRAEARI